MNTLSIIDYISLSVLSIVLVLGSWNPLLSNSRNDIIENSALGQYTIIIICFYFLYRLFFIQKIKIKIYFSDKLLFLFFVVFSCNSYIQIEKIEGNDIIFHIKLLVDIVFMILLRQLFEEKKTYIYYTILCYCIFSIIISLLFMLGFLETYTIIRSGRLYISGENPNSTSSRYALASIFLMFILYYNPYKWDVKRFLGLMFFVPLINIILVSGSRGSIIILTCCIVVFVLINKFSFVNKCYFIVSFILIFLIFDYYYFDKIADEYSIFTRFENMINGEDAGRSILIEESKRIFSDSPYFGYGAKGFTRQMAIRFDEERTVHHLFYYLLATCGIVGSIPFFLYILIIIYHSFRTHYYNSISLILLLFNLLLFSKTGGALTYALSWYLFAIISANNISCHREENKNINEKNNNNDLFYMNI